MSTAHWHILGPGAIGSLFAWYFSEAGLQVKLLTRRHETARIVTLETNQQLATRGFHVDNGDGPIQRLLVTVKAHQTETALQAIAPRINADTRILFLQNGMGTWQAAERLFPTTPWLVGTTTEGAWRAADHHIVHAGRGETWIGSLKPEWETFAAELVESLANTLFQPGLDGEIRQRLWHKLAINCAINPLTVLYDCRNGELLQKPSAVTQMQAICHEVEQVMAAALKQPLANGLWETVRDVAEKTGANQSSMLQDYRRGNSTEIEFITGYLVKEAQRLGIPVPENRKVLNALQNITG